MARIVLLLCSVSTLLALGYWQPDWLVRLKQTAENAVDGFVQAAGITGHLALAFAFGELGLTLLLAGFMLLFGLGLREQWWWYFTGWRIMAASALPLVAHVGEWAFGLYWPSALAPIYQLTSWLIDSLPISISIRLALFGGRDLIETAIITALLAGLWWTIARLWYHFRRLSSLATKPPTSGTTRRSAITNFIKRGWRMLTSMSRAARKRVRYLRNRFTTWRTRGGAQAWRSAMTNFVKQGWRMLTSSLWWLRSLLRKVLGILSFGLIREDARGLYFNELTWKLLMRPVASLLTGGFYTGIIWSVGAIFDFQILTGWWLVAVLVLTSLLVALPDTDEIEVVPEFYGLISTVFGVPVRIIRVNGRYRWSGKYTFLGEVSVVRVKTDKSGKEIGYMEGTRGKYIYLEYFPIAIWNSVDEKGMTLLSSLAKDGSTLYNTLVYNLRLHDPLLWVRNEDPVLLFAERARSALRNAVMYFTVRDNALVRNVISSLMNGYGVATAFIRKAEGGHKAGSIVRDRGDVPILERFSSSDNRLQDEATAVDKLCKRIRTNASDGMRKQVTENGEIDGEIDVEIHSVEESVDEILEKIGATIVSASIGQIEFSNPVRDAANAAASEEWQLEGQVMSAEAAGSYAAKLRELMPNDRELTKLDELQVVLGAAQDNPEAVKVTWVGGQYDGIGGSIIAAGQQLNK